MFEFLVLVDNVMNDEVGKVIVCVIKKNIMYEIFKFNFRNTSTNISIPKSHFKLLRLCWVLNKIIICKKQLIVSMGKK
jgi:hypothetical protein